MGVKRSIDGKITLVEMKTFVPKKELKKCFIATPIGDKVSDIRKKADGVIDAVIRPVLAELGYDPIIPHRMLDSGSITQNIIDHLLNDDLVVANLTGPNPNVMYELAVRHAVRKPIVCIIENNTELPFDIKDEWTIFYDNDMSGVVELVPKLKGAIVSAMKTNDINNPIYRSIEQRSIIKEVNLHGSNLEKLILNEMSSFKREVKEALAISERNKLIGKTDDRGHILGHTQLALAFKGPDDTFTDKRFMDDFIPLVEDKNLGMVEEVENGPIENCYIGKILSFNVKKLHLVMQGMEKAGWENIWK